ncbi:hypothetical protein ACFQL1_00560 [Halomicroarcula sp. GCM10025709]|uniref:hypothetical protein n=1 Tax=Halomicroarcula sp. GCM10025709 TaxID=3252669 RepID=UPI003615A749
MPSLVVHYAFVGLLAATLLGAAFDRRSLLLALAVVTFPDIDSFIALFSEVGHRAALTNLVIPAMLAALLVIDLHVREESLIRARWGLRGQSGVVLCVRLRGRTRPVRRCQRWREPPLADPRPVLSVQGTARTVYPAGDRPDLRRDGHERGSGGGSGGSGGGGLPTPNAMGNSSEIQMDTAVDPDPSGTADGPVDRIFPVARGGWQLYLLVVGTLATASRFLVGHDLPEE